MPRPRSQRRPRSPMSQETPNIDPTVDQASPAHKAGVTGTLRRLVSVPWVRNLLIAAAVIVLLMVLVDPLAGRWGNAVRHTDAVWGYRKVVGPLGHGTPWGIAFLAALLAAAVFRSARYLWVALAILLTFVWSGGLCHLVKIVVHRPRGPAAGD